jgi:hypothetical protein
MKSDVAAVAIEFDAPSVGMVRFTPTLADDVGFLCWLVEGVVGVITDTRSVSVPTEEADYVCVQCSMNQIVITCGEG